MARVLIVGGWPNVVLAAVLLTAAVVFHEVGLDVVTLVLVGHLSGLIVPTAPGRTGKGRTDVLPRVVNRREPE
jgi:hypothetical protein